MFSRHPDNMKTPSVSLLLGACVLLPSALTVSVVSLQVSPNLQQIFKQYASSVTVSCVDDDGQAADGWTVRIKVENDSDICPYSPKFPHPMFLSFCTLNPVSSGGSFLCEDSFGQQSDEVSIRVSEQSVILEIPALPVRAGSDVTLRCRDRRGSIVEAYFFLHGSHFGPQHQSELIITNVQKSDEGFYSCSAGVHKESLKSFLRVREPAPTSSSSPLPPCVSVLRLFCHLVVSCLLPSPWR